MDWRVEYATDDGREKVVGIVAQIEGAEGPTEVKITYTWSDSERYKVGSSGERTPKTGTDYKQEIADALDRAYTPKE